MAHAIFDLLVNLRQDGKTIIYVTHDHDLAKRATAGIQLHDGRIVDAFPADPVSGGQLGALFNMIGIAATSGVPNAEQGVAMSATQQMGNGLVLAVIVSISQARQASIQAQEYVMVSLLSVR